MWQPRLMSGAKGLLSDVCLQLTGCSSGHSVLLTVALMTVTSSIFVLSVEPQRDFCERADKVFFQLCLGPQLVTGGFEPVVTSIQKIPPQKQ